MEFKIRMLKKSAKNVGLGNLFAIWVIFCATDKIISLSEHLTKRSKISDLKRSHLVCVSVCK